MRDQTIFYDTVYCPPMPTAFSPHYVSSNAQWKNYFIFNIFTVHCFSVNNGGFHRYLCPSNFPFNNMCLISSVTEKNFKFEISILRISKFHFSSNLSFSFRKLRQSTTTSYVINLCFWLEMFSKPLLHPCLIYKSILPHNFILT